MKLNINPIQEIISYRLPFFVIFYIAFCNGNMEINVFLSDSLNSFILNKKTTSNGKHIFRNYVLSIKTFSME